ncbi:DUF4190 domain-containing protein [Streptomyces sp. SCUT-3]|nr:DUF4190 domain-containing protein [Streptomyces sp. SCUT-3]
MAASLHRKVGMTENRGDSGPIPGTGAGDGTGTEAGSGTETERGAGAGTEAEAGAAAGNASGTGPEARAGEGTPAPGGGPSLRKEGESGGNAESTRSGKDDGSGGGGNGKFDPWAPPAQDGVPLRKPSGPQPVPGNPYAEPPPPPLPGAVPVHVHGPGPGYGYGYGPDGSVGYWDGPGASNGVGTAALVCGIVALVLSVACFGAFLGFFVGIAALVCGILGLRASNRGRATNRGQALAGIWTGAISMVISAVVAAAFVGLAFYSEDFDEDYEDVAIAETYGSTVEYDNGVRVTLSTPERFEPSPSADGYTPGDDAYRMTVTLENGSGEPLDLSEFELYAYAGPRGIEVDEIYHGALGTGFGDRVAEGGETEAEVAFSVPPNRDDLEIEFLPDWSYEYIYWEIDLESGQAPEASSDTGP